MITQTTATEIVQTCEQINACICALELFKDDDSLETPFINVARNNEPEGITLFLDHDTAEAAIKKQLKILEAEHKSLNKQAIEEANSEESSK